MAKKRSPGMSESELAGMVDQSRFASKQRAAQRRPIDVVLEGSVRRVAPLVLLLASSRQPLTRLVPTAVGSGEAAT